MGGYLELRRHGQVAGGGERTGEIKFHVVEAPWPLDLAQKCSPDKKPRTRICQELEENTRRKCGGTSDMDGPAIGKHPGDYKDLVAGRRQQRGIKGMQETPPHAITRNLVGDRWV